jgi:hypothetical protein
LNYADAVYGLSLGIAAVRDARVKPRVPTALVVKSDLVMLWARLGSFNALEQHRPGGSWRRWLGGDLHSADNLGDVAAVIHVGHRRWSIENEAFNELVNEWHAGHVYKHDLNAMVVLWLLVCLACNLFHAFITRNLKPQRRHGHTQRHWARLMAADFHLRASSHGPRHPP